MSAVEIYPVPSGAKPSGDYQVEVNGRPVFTAGFAGGAYASFGLDGSAEVTVRPLKSGLVMPVVRPLRLGILPEKGRDGCWRFCVEKPEQLYLDFGGTDLMVFANPIETEKPNRNDEGVRFFAAGKVHDVGPIELKSGETLYLEGGAVVKGNVQAHGAENVRIMGPGVLDGRHYTKGSLKLITFDACRDVSVSGICTVGTPSWNLVFGACENVRVDGVKLIGWVVTSDGIDVVGSRDVDIRNSFLRCNDDCVAVKALDARREGGPQFDWRRDVSNVLVESCTLYNDKAGNAMEIGFETRTERMSGITFRDIDVIGAHGEGGVFTIHNGDRALVEDVLYEDIRVEHFYDKLVDFRVLKSRYSKDEERGRIRGVRLKDVVCVEDRFNTVSLIGGFDGRHPIEDVRFENFRIGERIILGADGLHLFERHSNGILFSE